jgi:hypothetical protein
MEAESIDRSLVVTEHMLNLIFPPFLKIPEDNRAIRRGRDKLVHIAWSPLDVQGAVVKVDGLLRREISQAFIRSEQTTLSIQTTQ